jgi:SAM-dependent methyltransferase
MNIEQSSKIAINSTIRFYDENAEEFSNSTVDVDMTDLYVPFLELMPAGGHILDAGCGSGRDSLNFMQMGYAVTAIDGSEAMAKCASERIGRPVEKLFFHEMDYKNCFDGIWASASLLHVPQKLQKGVFGRFLSGLKSGGVLHASYKYGEGEVSRGGRLFVYHNEATFKDFLQGLSDLKIVSMTKTEDQRPEKANEFWLNVILCKQS